MRNLILSILIIIFNLSINFSYGQSSKDSIEVVKTKNAIYFKHKDEMLKFKKLYKILALNPDSYLEIKKAKNSRKYY